MWEKWEMKSGSPDGVRRSNCILWSISSNAWRDPIRIKQLESRKQTRFWSCRLLCSSKSLATLYSPPRLRHKWNFQFKNIFLISSKSANVEVALEWRRFAQINQALTDGTNKRNQCQMATYNWFNYWYKLGNSSIAGNNWLKTASKLPTLVVRRSMNRGGKKEQTNSS